MAVEGSFVSIIGFSDGTDFIVWNWFQWWYRVHWLVLVSAAVQGSLVGNGFSGVTRFID